jgi:hypothetical protein
MVKDYSVAYMHVKKRNKKGPKGEREKFVAASVFTRTKKFWRLEAYQILIGEENSAMICWLGVHIAESHLPAGLNLMRCREKTMNPGRKREKRKK